MSDSSTSHSADASAVGYYHQGLYALVVLLDGGDEASVSVETADDVVLHDAITSLHQLKHSLGAPATLTVKNDGLWKTLGYWADGPFDGTAEFVFVTCAVAGSDLEVLRNLHGDRTVLLSCLESEANRVNEARRTAKKAGVDLPYSVRALHCERFLQLSPADRKQLVRLMRLTPESFTAADVPNEVADRLRSCVVPAARAHVVERLIEWWDRQIMLSLLGKRQRRITKLELQSRIADLIIEHSRVSLPDQFGDKTPDSLSAEIGGVMEQQIIWVRGKKARIDRAALARWRARNQRNRWLDGDFAAASELNEFDQRLIDAWGDIFHPMREDCEGSGDDECCEQGLKLLDWSHFDAHDSVEPLRPQSPHAFIVQGSLQQLAEEGTVGWHPDYVAMLRLFKSSKAT